MLILTLVCTAWLEIIGIQSARKEARRREAVERLAGMMDAFMYLNKSKTGSSVSSGYYSKSLSGDILAFKNNKKDSYVSAMFSDGSSPIGYQLQVGGDDLPEVKVMRSYGWGNSRWLVGRLYDMNGNENDVGNAFFTLPVCLGP